MANTVYAIGLKFVQFFKAPNFLLYFRIHCRSLNSWVYLLFSQRFQKFMFAITSGKFTVIKSPPMSFLPNYSLFLHPSKTALRFHSTAAMTHTDDKGKSKMVDVGGKEITRRTATAAGVVHVGPVVARLIEENNIKKGDAISIARLAGIMAAKKTSDLIPLCHNIPLNDVRVEATLRGENVYIEATVKCDGKTGVEMEALTAVTVAALALYDMCKAVTHDICIKEIKLMRKTGGSRGDFER